MKQSLLEALLAVIQALGPDDHALLIVVFMAFCLVGFSLYVLLGAIEALSKRK